MKPNSKCVRDLCGRHSNIPCHIREDTECESVCGKTTHICQVEDWVILRCRGYLQWFEIWIIPPNLVNLEGLSGKWEDHGTWLWRWLILILEGCVLSFCTCVTPLKSRLLWNTTTSLVPSVSIWMLLYFCFYFNTRKDPTQSNAGTTLHHNHQKNLSYLSSHILFHQH